MLAEAYENFYRMFEKDMGDRSGTVGASEIGQCARQTFWRKTENTKRGVERDDDYEEDWGARIRGVIMEFAFWFPAMRKHFGDDLLYAGTEQYKLVKHHLSATPDGLIINRKYDFLRPLGVKNIKSDCVTAECKTIDPRTNLVEAKEVNIYQTVVQMGLFQDMTPYKPHYSLLTYTDASFWSEVDEFPIEFDQFMYDAAHERASEIINAKSGADLMPEGWVTGGKECSFCPFTKACGVERRGIPRGSKKADPQFAAEMEDMARDYNVDKIKVAKLESSMKLKEIAIKDRLREKRVRRIEGVVNWYPVAAPVRYQNKEIRQEFIALGGDPDDFMVIGEPSDRIIIAATPNANKVVKASSHKKSNAIRRGVNAKQSRHLKRVQGQEKSNTVKRVSDTKKPTRSERAKELQKSTLAKRGKDNKKPKVLERAAKESKQPKQVNRAKGVKQPTTFKRSPAKASAKVKAKSKTGKR